MTQGTFTMLQRPLAIFLLAFAVVSVACVRGPHGAPVLDHEKRYTLEGFSVLSPPGDGWKVIERKQYQLAFGVQPQNVRRPTFSATVFWLALSKVPSQQRSELLKWNSDGMKRDGSTGRFRLISFNSIPEKFSGAECERYDTVSEDRGVPQRRGEVFILAIRGLACIHPTRPLFLKLEYSKRALKEEQLPAIASEADAFINTLQFS